MMFISLDGLSVGDAFGARLGEGWANSPAEENIAARQLPPAPWRWTDDTAMALSLVEHLDAFGRIEQDELAEAFAQRFTEEPHRGYGAGAYRLLGLIAQGHNWRDIAPNLFDGGSYGNGAAMRVAPLGAYFSGKPERAATAAKKQAAITHAHPEGQAGAAAVAVAASLAAEDFNGATFIEAVASHTPHSDVRDGLIRATRIPPDASEQAAKNLGTGWNVTAQDTVPFCVWVAAHHRTDYAAALWLTATGQGDRDTTCAIVGGIISAGTTPPPFEWLKCREGLPI